MVWQFLALWWTKTLERGVSRAPSQRTVFWIFFQHALRYQYETWYIHQVRVSLQLGHPDLLYSQEWVKVIFLHLWPQKWYRAFRFGTRWQISCFYPRHSQLTRHSLMLANGCIRLSLTALVTLKSKLLMQGAPNAIADCLGADSVERSCLTGVCICIFMYLYIGNTYSWKDGLYITKQLWSGYASCCTCWQYHTPRAPLTNMVLTLIPISISYNINQKVWDEITYPFPNLNVAILEVWEWISNFITHFTECVIIHPCCS